MPRRARFIVPGAPHHITQRGNNREPVFFAPEDYEAYLDCLTRQARLHGLRLLGYCLMPNHVHLIAVPDHEHSLARALGGAHSEYALALNRAQARSGHLWQNRYFSCPMDGGHLLAALRYVELNPVRAGLTAAAWDWRWSSARSHTVERAQDGVLDYRWPEYFDGWSYGEWREILAAGGAEGEEEAVRRATRTGEPLGSRRFVAELERRSGRRLRVLERGRPKRLPEKGTDEFS
jgi:putative transposase